MPRTRDWQIVLVDTIPKRWRRSEELVRVGVPLAVARRYARERYKITVGLKRRIRESKN